VPHTPRFRALTLFGRRLSERGDGLGIPASENLHKSGHAWLSASLRLCYSFMQNPFDMTF
jgi:hypothetical protein